MDNNLNLFLRSFRGELTEEDKIRLAELLEDSNVASQYEHYRKIWEQALAKGQNAVPEPEKSWGSLASRIKTTGKGRRILRYVISAVSVSAAAAVIAFFLIFNGNSNLDYGEELLTQAASGDWGVSTSDKIVFRTAEGKYYSVASKQADVTVEADGSISINSVQLGTKPAKGFNRIKVPRGKMVNLKLSDGSRICLNSLSGITFPSKFSGTDRMVYLEGEAYFEVARDEQRPFTALSDKMNVAVLGTQFNFATSGEESVVTLVSGKVQVETESSETCVLLPSQQVACLNGRLEEVKSVDVESVISWTSHKIICEDLNISEVIEKLSKYFDRDFVCREPLDDIYISGKLDLKEGLDSVLESIAFVAPVDFSTSDNDIIVNRKTIY
ncbi:MAG: FecR domain-containing protein [Rikenellaceae bacterium]|nr:FecR domain-containing protein [Rikenellaceae bacterium]MCI6319086.1 FecR domain-containing protein [Rikenellaceae bacterium]